MVLDKVESVVAGCSSLDIWLTSTRNQGGGRMYNKTLFGLPDRMMWVTGLIRFERARELIPKFLVNKNASCLVEKNFSADRPNGSYFQAVRSYSGDIKQFDKERTLLDSGNQS